MTADAKSPPSSPNEARNARSNIDHDLPCIGCGYNLRTLAADALCPECGRAVGESNRADHLQNGNLAWLRSLRRGATTIRNACAVELLVFGFLCTLALLGATRVSWGIYILCLFLSALLYCVGLNGAFLFLTPEPGNWLAFKNRPRVIARGSVVACGLLSLVTLLAGITGLLGLSAVLALAIAHLVFLILAIGAGTWYARQLALRAGTPRLVNSAVAVFITTFLACTNLGVVLFTAPAPPTRPTGGAGGITVAGMLLPLLIVAALICGLVLCTRFRIVLGMLIRRREKVENQ